MAYQGRKVWSAGDVLTASDMNATVDQTVMNFADASARNTAFPTGVEGAVVYLRDQNQLQFFNGSAWVGLGFGTLGNPVYANASARNSAIASPSNGMVVYVTDVAQLQVYSGGSWSPIGNDGIAVYANEAARNSAIPSPTAGLVVYIVDIAELQYYDGSAWQQVGTGAGGGSSGFQTTFLLMGA